MSDKLSKIRWVAHRGDCENHIENTLESIQAAIDKGIKHIEIDIQLTKEGLPIVFHDSRLKRMFGIDKQVANVNFKEIKQLPLKTKATNKTNNDYFIPTLLQVISLIQKAPDVTLYVEVKNVNFSHFSYSFVYNCITDCLKTIISQVVIIGFSYRFLRYVKNQSSLPIAYVLPSWAHYSPKMLANLKPEMIFADIDIIPTDARFHAKKEMWIVYEVSRIEQAQQLIKQGIFGFESFTPSFVKQQLTMAKSEL